MDVNYYERNPHPPLPWYERLSLFIQITFWLGVIITVEVWEYLTRKKDED